MTSRHDVTEIKAGLSAQLVIFRITELDDEGESVGGRTTDQVVAEGIIGSPEGRALGSPGDLRIRQDAPQVWQKVIGVRTVTGWQRLSTSGLPPRTVTTSETLIAADQLVLVDATAGPVTLGLPPAAASDGITIIVKKIAATINVVTVDANGTETIDDGLTATLTSQFEAIDMTSDATQWWIV